MDNPSTTAYPSLSDDPQSTTTAPSSSSSSLSAHTVDAVQPCLLLDTPPPIRSLMLDYMDDRTAILYLTTCHSLHTGYHHYPLKQPMAGCSFQQTTQLTAYYDQLNTLPMYVSVQLLAVTGAAVTLTQTQWPHNPPLLLVFAAVIGVLSLYLTRVLLLRRRVDCCTEGRWGMWRRRYVMPRVTRLSTSLRDVRLLPYMQHLTELTIAYDKRQPFGRKTYPLPHSLRTLHLLSSPDLTLTSDTLPPHLTLLSLSAVQNVPLPTGVLPQSLTSLQLMYGFDIRFDIGGDVLPAELRRLELYEWTLPLTRIVLPASLTELTIRWLSNHPLPALPPLLQSLAIGGAFNQPLTAVLPASLRTLRLTGHFDQPLTADVFASTPQLDELYLSDHSTHQLTADVLPRSLRVLRLGKQYSLWPAEVCDVPSRLSRVVVAAGWEVESVLRLQQLGERRSFIVEQEVA